MEFNKKLPKISIVTVTYNAQEYLEKTIQSIINQDYINIEYIIIDGNSTDNTINIIKKYEDFISYWISESDEGIYHAMNKAINIASGDWINFMNAGDTFSEKNIISKLIPFLSDEFLVLTGYTNVVNKNGKVIYCEFPMLIENIYTDFRLNHQSTFTKLSVMKKFYFDLHYKYASDVDFFMKINLNKSNFRMLPFPIANFLIGGFWQQNSVFANIEILNIVSNYLNKKEDIFNQAAYKELYHERFRNILIKNNQFNLQLNKFIINIENFRNKYKRIILYGFGHSGKICKQKLTDNLVGILDKNIKVNNDLFITPNMLKDIDYDIILISVLGREPEIEDYLINQLNVEKNKIVRIDLNGNFQ